MPKPIVTNHYVVEAIQVWNTPNYTFCLIDAGKGSFKVRVFPHDERESFWLDGSWETESGTAWSVLNYLNNQGEG